jgi:tetratricopeptide (TPR) repeat protein
VATIYFRNRKVGLVEQIKTDNTIMRKIFIALGLCFILFFAGNSLSQSASGYISQGDSLYSLFDYTGSADNYERACALDSANFEPFWKLARSLNLMGETAIEDSQETIFEKARDVSEYALTLNDDHAEPHFQLARSCGKIALFHGIFKSASLAKKVKREVERAIEIDSLHDGAWHILGRWHREVGKKPKFLRIPMGLGAANKEDALAFMQKAIEIKPDYINHHLEMGITYKKFKMKDLAIAEFNKCLELPWSVPLDDKYKEEAKKYLDEMTDN